MMSMLRELGQHSPRYLPLPPDDLVQRLKLHKELEFHQGCVNTVSWDHQDCGRLLITGSDDTRIALWDWQQGRKVHHFNSWHSSNIFQAKSLPCGGFNIVSSAADGDVLLHKLRPEGGNAPAPIRIVAHESRAHKLALAPESPGVFLTCGEDGLVFAADIRTRGSISSSPILCTDSHSFDLLGLAHGLYSINFNPSRPWQFCIGGQDVAVRIFDLRNMFTGGTAANCISAHTMDAKPVCQLAPRRLLTDRGVGPSVTSAVFSQQGDLVASYNDEDIHLFPSQLVNSSPSEEQTQADDGNDYGAKEVKNSFESPSGDANGTASDGSKSIGKDIMDYKSEEEEEEDEDVWSTLPWGAIRRPSIQQRYSTYCSNLPPDRGPNPFSCAQFWTGNITPVRSSIIDLVRITTVLDRHKYRTAITPIPVNRWQDGGMEHAEWTDIDDDVGFTTTTGTSNSDNNGGSTPSASARTSNSNDGSGDDSATTSSSTTSSPSSGRNDGVVHAAASPSTADNEVWPAVPIPIGIHNGTHGAHLRRGASSPSRSMRSASFSSSSSEDADSDDDVDDGDGTRGTDDSSSEDNSDKEGSLSSDNNSEDRDLSARWSIPRMQGSPASTVAFRGHRNNYTVKGVNFFGPNDEYIISGSDCGHIYVWNRHTRRLITSFVGDENVVNCLEPHPSHMFTLATSGIDNHAKVWTPTAKEPLEMDIRVLRRGEANQRMKGQEGLYGSSEGSDSEDD